MEKLFDKDGNRTDGAQRFVQCAKCRPFTNTLAATKLGDDAWVVVSTACRVCGERLA